MVRFGISFRTFFWAALVSSAAMAQSPYLPLAEGNRWELRFADQSMVLRVAGRSSDSVRVRWENPWNRTEFLFIPRGNRVLLSGLDMGNGVAPMPPGTAYFDFDMRQGGSWSNVLGTMTVMARDRRLETPAGRFENCIEIRATDKNNFSTFWTFAPGVGFVRFGRGDASFLLTSYSGGDRGRPDDDRRRRQEPPHDADAPARNPSGTQPAIFLALDANSASGEGYAPDAMRKRFHMAVDSGTTYTSFLPKWDELESGAGQYRFNDLDQRVNFAEECGVPISLNVRVVDGDHRSIPSAYQRWNFDDPRMSRALDGLLRAVGPRVRGRVKWIALGNEVDHYFDGHRSEIGPYAKLLHNVMGTIRQQFPGALFTVNFSEQRLDQLHDRFAPITSTVDFYSFNYYPVNSDFTVKDPDSIGLTMDRMIQAAEGKPVMFQELGYPSSEILHSSEEQQARFVANAFEELRRNRGKVVAATFNWMSDLPQEVVDQLGRYYGMANSDKFKAFLGSIGLFDRNGRPKRAWTEFQRQAARLSSSLSYGSFARRQLA